MKPNTQQAAARLRQWAKDEVARFGAETAAGGEPPVPQAAYDLLEVLEAFDAATMTEAA